MSARRRDPDRGEAEPERRGLVLANLDCEQDWVREFGKPAPTAARSARERASILAAGLQVFARSKHDRIWTPAAIRDGVWRPLPDSTLTARVDGRIEGRLDGLLAWGETREAAALRRRLVAQDAPSPRAFAPAVIGEDLPEWMLRLWAIRPSGPEVAARVNHRAFALALARRHGWALPGEDVVGSRAEFETWLETGGAAASPNGRWILREPLSAAGRGRLLGAAGTDRSEVRRRIEAMLRRQGELHCAPWMERIEDFGLVGLVDEAGPLSVGWHRQEIRGHGAFAGSILHLDDRWPVSKEKGESKVSVRALSREDRATLCRAFDRVGESLMEEGFRGPFGIDAWTYRDRSGVQRLHPLGEVNARLTMGHVAWAFVDRFAERLGWRSAGEIRMRIGSEEEGAPEDDFDAGRWVLARWTDANGPSAFWMEARGPAG